MRSSFRYTSSVLVVLVAGATNLGFAWTLGAELPARLIALGLSAATAVGTATGPHFIYAHCRNRNWAGLGLALLWFACCLAWDGWSAYGFTVRQHSLSAQTAADATRRRSDAESDVRKAEADLARYAGAPDPNVAKTELDELTAQLDEIGRQPGVMFKGVPCGRANDDELRELCGRRAALGRQLDGARTAVAAAEAKGRAEFTLATARRALNSMPAVAPVDPRAQVLGEWAVEWFPVVLLTIGAATAFFAVPPESPKFEATGPAPAEAPDTPAVAAAAPGAQRQRRKKGTAGQARVAQRIASLAVQPKRGMFVDKDGWVRATQRQLATASGYRSLSVFNRDLHDAVVAGLIELDTSNGTAVRAKEPA